MVGSSESPPKKRILLVVPEYKTGLNSGGGVESVTDFVLGALADRTEWEVSVASLRMSRRAVESRRLFAPGTWKRGPVTHTRDVEGIRIHDIGASLAELELARYLPRKQLDLLAAGSDVVMVISGTPAAAYTMARTNRPVVLQTATLAALEREALNGGGPRAIRIFRKAMTRTVSHLDGLGLLRADVVLVENHNMQRTCEVLGARDVRLIPPGVDTDAFYPDSRVEKQGYLLLVGRLSDPRKDLATLFRAFHFARAELGVTQRLVLAGLNGPSDDDFQILDSLGIRDHVDVILAPSHADLVRIYQQADLFVMSSREEGLGIVLLEAMACGIPIVSTATHGAVYALEDAEAGELVKLDPAGLDTWEPLARAMAKWANDRDLRTRGGLNGRRHVEQNFSATITGANFRQVLRECVNQFEFPGCNYSAG